MKIKLHCSNCGHATAFPFSELFLLWREGVQQLNLSSQSRKENLQLCADITCFCGTTESFDSPLFQHIFHLILNAGMK